MDTKATLLTLLASPAEPRWTISAIARAAGVPWYAVRRYVREPNAGLREEYQAQIDAFALSELSELKETKTKRKTQ
jgi:hypothetical protein